MLSIVNSTIRTPAAFWDFVDLFCSKFEHFVSFSEIMRRTREYNPYSGILWSHFALIPRKSKSHVLKRIMKCQFEVRWKVQILARRTVDQPLKFDLLKPISRVLKWQDSVVRTRKWAKICVKTESSKLSGTMGESSRQVRDVLKELRTKCDQKVPKRVWVRFEYSNPYTF